MGMKKANWESREGSKEGEERGKQTGRWKEGENREVDVVKGDSTHFGARGP